MKKATRADYYPATYDEKRTFDQFKAEVFITLTGTMAEVKAFSGRSAKPDFWVKMQKGNLETRITSWLERLQAKADYEAKCNAPSQLKVGDILQGSWGYEQTNQVFVKVVATRGTKQVVLQRLKVKTAKQTGDMSRYVIPLDEFADVETRVCVVKHGSEASWHEYCSVKPWNGQPQMETSYA